MREYFFSLLNKHVEQLWVRGWRIAGICPFHDEDTPSFSANVERGIWQCFGCGKTGGIRDFAIETGEKWPPEKWVSKGRSRGLRWQSRSKPTFWASRDERDKTLAHCVYGQREMITAKLLEFFYTHPIMTQRFPDIVVTTEERYADAILKQQILFHELHGE